MGVTPPKPGTWAVLTAQIVSSPTSSKGLLLDSTVLVSAERRGQNASQMLAHIADLHGSDTAIGISVITIAELAHGVVRADNLQRRQMREGFIRELLTAVPSYPITEQIALRAGQINGESQAKGVSIGFPDLLIGVTALEHGYAVATANVRHYKMIPNLEIVELL